MAQQIPHRNSRLVARDGASFYADGARVRSRASSRSCEEQAACRAIEVLPVQIEPTRFNSIAYSHKNPLRSASPTPLFSVKWQKSAQPIEKRRYQLPVFSYSCALFSCNPPSFSTFANMTGGIYTPAIKFREIRSPAPFARHSSRAARHCHCPEAALPCSEPFASLGDSPLDDATS
jgi:hypothetical protein